VIDKPGPIDHPDAAQTTTPPTQPVGDLHETPGTSDRIFEVVGAILASAVNDDGPDGDEIRRVLRPIVVRQLDDELAVTGPLVPYFRGQIDA
jgi:hypothetical protein